MNQMITRMKSKLFTGLLRSGQKPWPDSRA
jgi:hypothetical protein